jgi:hypothetical protein
MSIPMAEGGLSALLDGRPFPQEYPTDPPSFVLNGGMFAMWGWYDVGRGLGDGESAAEFGHAADVLASNLHRWDSGSWSLYDLYPHRVANVASFAYHRLHIDQLTAMHRIAPRPEFSSTAERFQRYAQSRSSQLRAFARKVMFRLLVPRRRTANAENVPAGV